MLTFDLYAICTSYDEYDSNIDEFFLSFEEAMIARKDYANWCCSKGDVWIYKYPAGVKSARPSEKWHINKDGNIVYHYVR